MESKDGLVGEQAALDAPLDPPAHAIQVAVLLREALLILELLLGVLHHELSCFYPVYATDFGEEGTEEAALSHEGVGQGVDLVAGNVLGLCDIINIIDVTVVSLLEEGYLRVDVACDVDRKAVLIKFLLVLDLTLGDGGGGCLAVGGGLVLRVLLDNCFFHYEIALQELVDDDLVAEVPEKLGGFRNVHVAGARLSYLIQEGGDEEIREVVVDIEYQGGAVSTDAVTSVLVLDLEAPKVVDEEHVLALGDDEGFHV